MTTAYGSSPRMRGTHNLAVDGVQNIGIIPAHAGNTDRIADYLGQYGDHPRACGEHIATSAVVTTVLGSSPRMRGTPEFFARLSNVLGIIPAHAGNTGGYNIQCLHLRDHPRACGEHTHRVTMNIGGRGSSPRMRGTLQPSLPFMSKTGIIPAHAGNTQLVFAGVDIDRDHPRACGEHPRTYPTRAVDCGIIPAHAGNTQERATKELIERDHPRACGEHLANGAIATRLAGSSPRMRGTRGNRAAMLVENGIIPAHAGNTPPESCLRGARGDHPRACGEHPPPFAVPKNAMGSSPRMRGTRTGRIHMFSNNWIIPAHAGNTKHRLDA